MDSKHHFIPGTAKCVIKGYDAGVFRKKLRYYIEISYEWNGGGRAVVGKIDGMHKNDLPRVAALIESGLNSLKTLTLEEQAQALTRLTEVKV